MKEYTRKAIARAILFAFDNNPFIVPGSFGIESFSILEPGKYIIRFVPGLMDVNALERADVLVTPVFPPLVFTPEIGAPVVRFETTLRPGEFILYTIGSVNGVVLPVANGGAGIYFLEIGLASGQPVPTPRIDPT